MGKSKMQLRKGFTIVELMVVIAIIGIMATVASFAWQRYVNNTNLRTAARELAADINSMKAKAVSKTDTDYTIDFDTAANTYTLNGTTVQTKLLTSFGQGIRITEATTPTITCQKRGTLSPLGHVILSNNRGSNATIKFNITGKTHVTFGMR
jgi:type II secretion system protein H